MEFIELGKVLGAGKGMDHFELAGCGGKGNGEGLELEWGGCWW